MSSRRFSYGEAGIDVSVGRAAVAEPPEAEEPFQIALLGDFSGRANRGLRDTRLSLRHPILIDRDNFDQVLARLGVELRLPVGGAEGQQLAIRFRELDDFQPDRLFERLELFQALRRTRNELLDPATYQRAAEALRAPEPPQPPSPPPERAAPVSLDDLLQQNVQATESRAPGAGAARPLRDEWSQLLHDIVAPHVVPGAPPEQARLVAEVDAAIGAQMRALLHHPDFQALEAAWRAVFFLVRRLETGPQLELHLLDISKAELAADLAAAEDPRRSETRKLLVERTVGTPGASLWAALVGNYTFEATPGDCGLLAGLASIAREAGAPLLAAASARFLGCESLARTPDPDEWQQPLDAETSRALEELRRRRESAWLGLALPRFLLRLPYGKETYPTEQFDFEEMPGGPVHQDYLWGNPAFACACLLGEAFSRYGWSLRPGQVRELDGLPTHVYVEAGEPVVKPCAEVLLTERAAEAILDRGPMPLVSVRGRDAARLFRFQSMADPAASLAGRWE